MNTTSLAEDFDALIQTGPEPGTIASIDEARALRDDIPRVTRSRADEIVHLGTLLGLEFHRILALLLKHEWEQLLAQVLGGADDQVSSASGEVDTSLLQKRFAPDSGALFHALARHRHVPNGIVYDARSLADTIHEMVLIDLHRLPNTGAELQAFAERNQRALALLRRESKEIQAVFLATKREWMTFQDEFAERLLYLERRRLESENLTQKWLAVFGEAYVLLMEQAARVAGLQRRIEMKLADPELTRDALEQIATEAEAVQRQQLQQLRHRLGLATSWVLQHQGTPVSYEQLGEYRRECKLALREIWLLIHPDKLAQHPQYDQLTKDQKKLLDDLWHRAMTVRAEELGFEPGFLGAEYRSLTVLRDIIETVQHILTHVGINTDVNLIVKGDTVEQQIEWLQHSIRRLEGELDSVQVELMALINDRDVQERAALLAASPKQQEKANREMLDRARDQAEHADRMEAHLARLFESENAHA